MKWYRRDRSVFLILIVRAAEDDFLDFFEFSCCSGTKGDFSTAVDLGVKPPDLVLVGSLALALDFTEAATEASRDGNGGGGGCTDSIFGEWRREHSHN